MSGNLVSSGKFLDGNFPTLKKRTLVMILSEQSPGLLGMTAQIPKDNKFVLNQRVAEIRPNYDIDSYFLSKSINNSQKYFSKRGAGTKVQNISKPNVENFELYCPEFKEQQQLGDFFKQLDNTLTLHQRKLDKLKLLKQGYLQQLFPQNDEKVPRVRFANFENEWKQCKLGEISKMYQPQTITGTDLLASGYPVFGANGYIGFYSEFNHKKDQVTISARGEGTGTPSYVNGPAWITGNSMVVNVEDSGVVRYFLYASLSLHSLKKYVTGGAQPQLTRDVLIKVPILLPIFEEQKKIGALFKHLDKTINLHQSKLNKLNSLKQALLQKMFI